MKMRFACVSLTLCALATAPCVATPSRNDTSVIGSSRHSFRGVTRRAGPQNLAIPELGLSFHFPILSYARELSPRGEEVARRFARDGLNRAAAMALANCGGHGPFHGWDEIRIDMSTSRDFFTAVSFKEALDGSQSRPISLTGTPTVEDEGVDPVSLAVPVLRCVPRADLKRLRRNAPTLPRVREAAEQLLSLLKRAGVVTTGHDLSPVNASGEDADKPVYAQIKVLASTIEMASDLGPPLEQLFPKLPRERLKPLEAEAVRRASGYLGVRFTAVFPIELARARCALQLAYVSSIAPGRHVIVASHDDDVSSLLRSLDLVSDKGPVDDLTVYPLESVLIALNAHRVSVVRLRPKLRADGVFTGTPVVRVIWHGTRAEWDAKSAKVERLARDWAPGATERAQLRIPPAEPLDVLLRPR